MTTPLPAFIVLALSLATSGCSDHWGSRSYEVFAIVVPSASGQAIEWNDAANAPPELPALLAEASQAAHEPGPPESATLLVSRQRQAEIREFLASEWERQMGHPAPSNGTFRIHYGSDHVDVYATGGGSD